MKEWDIIKLTLKRDIDNKPYDWCSAVIKEVYEAEDILKVHILGIGIEYIRGYHERIEKGTIKL